MLPVAKSNEFCNLLRFLIGYLRLSSERRINFFFFFASTEPWWDSLLPLKSNTCGWFVFFGNLASEWGSVRWWNWLPYFIFEFTGWSMSWQLSVWSTLKPSSFNKFGSSLYSMLLSWFDCLIVAIFTRFFKKFFWSINNCSFLKASCLASFS